MTEAAPFDPLAALQALHQEGVRFVVIGGIAARLLGSPTVTRDLDICYARDTANLERLARVLARLEARLRGAPPDLPFRPDARTLAAGDHFTLATTAGDLDVLGTPAGVAGYAQLERMAERLDLDGMTVLVASLDDLIAMKRAAGRPKDLVELEILGALRDEVEG
jgi:glutathione S-transferase